MIRTTTILSNKTPYTTDLLLNSKLIYNQSLFFLRQAYFHCTKNNLKIKTPSYNELYHSTKITEAYINNNLDSVVKQSCIKQAFTNWKSFICATMAYVKTPSKFKARPQIPNYLKNNHNIVTIDKTRLRSKGTAVSQIKLPNSNYIINLPPDLNKNRIKCVRILQLYTKIKIEIIYEKETELKIKPYDNNKAIGIDLGLNNLAAITSNDTNLSVIINGRPLKSINQFYNKNLALLKSKKATKQIERLSQKRKQKVDNYLHWASKQIINLCLTNEISTIVIGKNDSWKQDINLGKRTNQNFVQIPHTKFIQMIQYKAEEVRITVKVVEESYTSKVDHLALEPLKKQETYLGKRTKRGLFGSSVGSVLNADVNGAIGILRKGKAITDAQLVGLRDRGDVVSPKVLLKKS